MEKREILAEYACRCGGDWSLTALALKNHEAVCGTSVKEPYITIYDSVYPDSLRQLRFPPWVLFYRGNPALLKNPAVSIVGSRRPCDYGRRMAVLSAGILARRFTVVSGLARGIDGLVHRSVLSCGKTIGVIGSGHDFRYPEENAMLYREMEKEHLILSEYPRDTEVQRKHFPWRNRIIAALGQCTVVVQAGEKSGTMLTVNEALALSREVYCFPYRMDDPCGSGCNLLISQGAVMIRDRHDLEQIGRCRTVSVQQSLSSQPNLDILRNVSRTPLGNGGNE